LATCATRFALAIAMLILGATTLPGAQLWITNSGPQPDPPKVWSDKANTNFLYVFNHLLVTTNGRVAGYFLTTDGTNDFWSEVIQGAGGGASNALVKFQGNTNAFQWLAIGSAGLVPNITTNGVGANGTNTINLPTADNTHSGILSSSGYQLLVGKQESNSVLAALSNTRAITNVGPSYGVLALDALYAPSTLIVTNFKATAWASFAGPTTNGATFFLEEANFVDGINLWGGGVSALKSGLANNVFTNTVTGLGTNNLNRLHVTNAPKFLSLLSADLLGTDSGGTVTARTAGIGLSLSGSTLMVSGNSTTQKVEVALNGTPVGSQPQIDYIAGANITLGLINDSGNNRTRLTIATGGASQTPYSSDHNGAGNNVTNVNWFQANYNFRTGRTNLSGSTPDLVMMGPGHVWLRPTNATTINFVAPTAGTEPFQMMLEVVTTNATPFALTNLNVSPIAGDRLALVGNTNNFFRIIWTGSNVFMGSWQAPSVVVSGVYPTGWSVDDTNAATRKDLYNYFSLFDRDQDGGVDKVDVTSCIVVADALGGLTNRVIAGGTGITVTDGNGQNGNPTVAITSSVLNNAATTGLITNLDSGLGVVTSGVGYPAQTLRGTNGVMWQDNTNVAGWWVRGVNLNTNAEQVSVNSGTTFARVLDKNGNAGFGINVPASKVHVNGSTTHDGVVTNNDTTVVNSTLVHNGADQWKILTNSYNGLNVFLNLATNTMQFLLVTNNFTLILTNQNVGQRISFTMYNTTGTDCTIVLPSVQIYGSGVSNVVKSAKRLKSAWESQDAQVTNVSAAFAQQKN
jgi:hypothetical protein